MFQATKFLDCEFESPEQMRSILRSYGFPALSRDAIYKVRMRDNLSAKWLALLLCVLELERGRPVSVIPYIKH